MFLITNIFFYFYLGESFTNQMPNRWYVFYISITILSTVSFIDDFRPISPILRLLLQITLIFFSISLLDLYLLDIPLKIKLFLVSIIWIYILNITNFVDGSDGFLSTILLFFFSGVIFSYNYLNLEFDFTFYMSVSCIFLLAGLLILNKPIAKTYMGDTGSIFFGYIVGFIILDLSLKYNLWHIMVGLFSYPLADCSKALFIKTIFKKKYPWERLDDYSFLMPIIDNKLNQKNVFKYILIFSFINFLIVLLGIIHDTQFYLIFNFAIAYLLMRIFEKNKNLELKNILKIKLL
ncbi:MAG: hypothetical protein CBE48_001035 [Flavobacteriales bacterium TMED288]|nr:MAG: hypothetical protein CBE48_001035 [Flavobacteriales bacterium TMED288]